MNAKVFEFGEQRAEFPIRVLNERVVRAGAGLMFVFAMVAFMQAWLVGNFQPTRVFVTAFLIDFTIRLFVNPRYAPSLIAAQWLVRKQQPEYVGAAQKRFAWGLGFALALLMFYLIVVRSVVGPVNMMVCGLCLILMGFESAFGICIGCWLYNRIRQDPAQLCPGGVCAYEPTPDARPTLLQGLWVLAFLGVIVVVARHLPDASPSTVAARTASSADPAQAHAEAERCRVPEFAKAIGHEAMWKLHNRCP